MEDLLQQANLVVAHFDRLFLTSRGCVDLLLMSYTLPSSDFQTYIQASRLSRSLSKR